MARSQAWRPHVSVQVTKVGPEAFAQVHREILHTLDARLSVSQWERLFQWPWPNPEDHVGIVMTGDSGQILAFVGLLFSRQTIQGRPELVCNLSSWVARDGYGASSLALLTPLLRRPDLTITNLTPTPAVNQIFRRLGFDTLETHTRVFLPFRSLSPIRYRVHSGADAADAVLSEAERRVRNDHRGCGEHLIVEGRRGRCLVLHTMGRRRRLRTARVHHLSDPDVFVDALPSLHRHLLGRGVPLIECDERLVGGRATPFSLKVPLPEPRLFRSRTCAAADVTNAYSELILLNF